MNAPREQQPFYAAVKRILLNSVDNIGDLQKELATMADLRVCRNAIRQRCCTLLPCVKFLGTPDDGLVMVVPPAEARLSQTPRGCLAQAITF